MARELIIFDRPAKKVPVMDPANMSAPLTDDVPIVPVPKAPMVSSPKKSVSKTTSAMRSLRPSQTAAVSPAALNKATLPVRHSARVTPATVPEMTPITPIPAQETQPLKSEELMISQAEAEPVPRSDMNLTPPPQRSDRYTVRPAASRMPKVEPVSFEVVESSMVKPAPILPPDEPVVPEPIPVETVAPSLQKTAPVPAEAEPEPWTDMDTAATPISSYEPQRTVAHPLPVVEMSRPRRMMTTQPSAREDDGASVAATVETPRQVWAKEIVNRGEREEARLQMKPRKPGLLGGIFQKKINRTLALDESMDMEALYQKGLATIKDLIAPPAIRVTPATMQIGDVVARTLFVITYPRFLSTNWFSPIINLDFPMDTALFIHPIETAETLKQLRKSATQVQSQMNIESEEGKIRDPVLEAALQNIEELRDRLQQGTEKFFRFGLYMTLYGADEKDLTEKERAVEAILEAQLVYTKPAVLRMDVGFSATRPLAVDSLDVANNLNTEPLSTTFPFVSSDLSSNEGIFYGINRHNNSLILFDRFKMENANMVVFAKSGAGKSYTVKLEVLRAMMFESSVIIIDPENEYKHLCETVGGAFLKISLNSDIHLNPFDMPKVNAEDESEGVFRNTVANLIGLLHLMLGTLSAEEDSIIDQAIRETYAIRDIHEGSDFGSLTANSFPTMSDLYVVLKNMEGADQIAARLQRYTEGIFSGFLNEQTNIDTDNQLVVFNIRDLEEELRPIAMYIVLQYIWNDIRSKLRQRFIVVDEAWIMMQNEDAASFLFGIAKRCRKYYTGLTTITQDISDFMTSRYGKPIITNSSMQLLLRQSPASIDYITETFYLTDHEKFLLLESNVGEGIFFAGTKHAAIKVLASYSEDQIITSDPRQLLEIEEAKREFDAQNP